MTGAQTRRMGSHVVCIQRGEGRELESGTQIDCSATDLERVIYSAWDNTTRPRLASVVDDQRDVFAGGLLYGISASSSAWPAPLFEKHSKQWSLSVCWTAVWATARLSASGRRFSLVHFSGLSPEQITTSCGTSWRRARLLKRTSLAWLPNAHPIRTSRISETLSRRWPKALRRHFDPRGRHALSPVGRQDGSE